MRRSAHSANVMPCLVSSRRASCSARSWRCRSSIALSFSVSSLSMSTTWPCVWLCVRVCLSAFMPQKCHLPARMDANHDPPPTPHAHTHTTHTPAHLRAQLYLSLFLHTHLFFQHCDRLIARLQLFRRDGHHHIALRTNNFSRRRHSRSHGLLNFSISSTTVSTAVAVAITSAALDRPAACYVRRRST
jgi:hypothetical protein